MKTIKRVLTVCRLFGLFPYSLDGEGPLRRSVTGTVCQGVVVTALVTKTVLPYRLLLYSGDESILTIIYYVYLLALTVPLYKSLFYFSQDGQYFNDLITAAGPCLDLTYRKLDLLMAHEALLVSLKVALYVWSGRINKSVVGLSDAWLFTVTFADTLLVSLVVSVLEACYHDLLLRTLSTLDDCAGLRSLRRRHLDLYRLTRRTNSVFGLRNLVSIVLYVINSMQYIYSLLYQLTTELHLNYRLVVTSILSVELTVSLIVLAFSSTGLAHKYTDFFDRLVDIDLSHLSTSSLTELGLLLEDLSTYRIEIKCYDCFCVDVPCLYSIAGGLFGYALVIGPPMSSQTG